MHGAMLAAALKQERPELRLCGMVGPELAKAGVEPVASIEDLSVMGLNAVLAKLPTIIRTLKHIQGELKTRRPDAVILIDAPDFSFRVGKMAHALGIPVFYYISPKLWAWRQGRVKYVKKYVKSMISILPFEVEFYKERGVEVEYVGNPILDLIDWPRINKIKHTPGKILLLPGSRKKEVKTLLPEFGKAAKLLLERDPSLSFTLVRASSISESELKRLWPRSVPVHIAEPEDRYATMRSCSMAVAASGTATLETALLGLPTIAAYKLSPIAFALAWRFVQIHHISLANLILQQRLFPELLQNMADGANIAEHAWVWLENPMLMDGVRARLDTLHALLGRRNAPLRAAQHILQTWRD